MAREDHDVPASVRRDVLDRDGHCCRVCGQYVTYPALHHIEYRSQGGANIVDNLITIGWLPGHDCHLPVVHADKGLWQPILQQIVHQSGVTALAYRRQLGGSIRSNVRPRPLIGWPEVQKNG